MNDESRPSRLYDIASYGLSWAYGKTRGVLQSKWSTDVNANNIDPEQEQRVWIGDIATASNAEELKSLGITHVVSAILGIGEMWPEHFKYHIVHVRDVDWEMIGEHFHATADFIQQALEEHPDNKVFVHCVCGVSRSASLLSAWLIKYREMTTEQAIEHLQSIREIVKPIPGFVSQLKAFEESIASR